MKLFLHVVESGSFVVAARSYGLSQPTVSKRISQLESRLGVQLLHRTTRGLRVTEAGKSYITAAGRALECFEDAESLARQHDGNLSGLVNVAMPAAFGREHVLPQLPEFFRRFPEMSLRFDVSGRATRSVYGGVDVAIHVGDTFPSKMVGRRVGSVQHMVVTTPEFLHRNGFPGHPREICSLPAIVFLGDDIGRLWRFEGPDGPFTVEPHAVFGSNDMDVTRAVTLAHRGITYAPRWMFRREIAAGVVSEILSGFRPEPCPVNVVFPSGRRQPRRIRAFTEFLAEQFASIPEIAIPGVGAGTSADPVVLTDFARRPVRSS